MNIESEIISKLHLLDKKYQNKVLLYIKSLLKKSTDDKSSVIKFAGFISTEDLNQISKSIEESQPSFPTS
jgi:hypothetical protein